jgi:hypothetical protein
MHPCHDPRLKPLQTLANPTYPCVGNPLKTLASKTKPNAANPFKNYSFLAKQDCPLASRLPDRWIWSITHLIPHSQTSGPRLRNQLYWAITDLNPKIQNLAYQINQPYISHTFNPIIHFHARSILSYISTHADGKSVGLGCYQL